MDAAQNNASTIASFLESHDGVERVVFPGLASHPQHAIAKKQALLSCMSIFEAKNSLEFLCARIWVLCSRLHNLQCRLLRASAPNGTCLLFG
jgi:cystathionine beta-lyase/cystathionine gamma-synthase